MQVPKEKLPDGPLIKKPVHTLFRIFRIFADSLTVGGLCQLIPMILHKEAPKTQLLGSISLGLQSSS